MTTVNAALLAAALLFVLFVVAQALLPALIGRGKLGEANVRLSSTIARATGNADLAERAAGLREASTLALTELRRPRLAVRYALWALEAAPGDPANVPVLAAAMMRAKRLRALERHLWELMDEHPAVLAAAYDALLELYDGPMKTPERARVLRALRAR